MYNIWKNSKSGEDLTGGVNQELIITGQRIALENAKETAIENFLSGKPVTPADSSHELDKDQSQ